MSVSLKGRSLTTLQHFRYEEIMTILETAQQLKLKNYSGEVFQPLKGKILAMIFQKPSLRTRVSFEVGMVQLGGQAIYLAPEDIKIGEREPAEDAGRVLGRYIDCIMARTFKQSLVEELAKYSGVPVINGLSDYEHPCQALADFQTILEKKRRIDGLQIAYIGDGNNVCNSLMFMSAILGAHMNVASPKVYEPDKTVVKTAKNLGLKTNSVIRIMNNPREAVKNADVVYADVWASMGQESERKKRVKLFKGFQIDRKLFESAGPEAIFLHCLPAHYGEETTHEVVYHERSAVFDQAENRLHAQKAVLTLLIT